MARDSWLKRLIWLRGSPAGGSGASYEKTVGPAPIISISDAKPKPAKSLIVGMEPIQAGSGDPSPDNIRPISGRTGLTAYRTGKNLLSDGTTHKNGSSYFVGASSGSEYPFFFKAGTYTASNEGTASYMYWQLKGTSINNIIHNGSTTVGTFTLSQDGWYRFWFYTADADASYTNIQIELGSNASDYSEYSGATYPVTWQDEAGTVYGGTVDVVTGVLTVTHISENYDGSSDESWTTSGSGNYVAKAPLMLGGSKPISSAYPMETSPATGEFKIRPINNNLDYASLADWKAYLAETPLQVVYELETPQTYQLTPQAVQMLKGANNLWSDADNLTLTYIGTTPPNLLGGMLGGGFGGGYNPPAEQDPEELTEPEATETDEPAKETPAEEGENNGE